MMNLSNTIKATSVFSPEQLSKIVAETLPGDAKPGEKIIVGAIDQTGAQVLIGFKNKAGEGEDFNWEAQAVARHNWAGDNQVDAKVVMRW
jgi:hypothetical protein